MRLDYTYEELMADPPYAARLRRESVLFHGGLDANDRYLPPRSRYRTEAIANWSARLAGEGHPTGVITLEQVERAFFPNVGQAKLLLRHGARGAMTRILTLIGITEGFGNDGIKIMPQLDLPSYFVEPLDGTCLRHLYTGLFEAHGNDEAGRGNEAGHDVMWYAIRDAALNAPPVTADMFENLPIAPPPGYTGPAKPAPEAISVGEFTQPLFPSLDPMFELLLSALAQILVIELMAYTTFRWAQEVLADGECSAAPEFAPRMVGYIQADENMHVGYLQCALAEVRCRTIRDCEGRQVAGVDVIDSVCQRVVSRNTGARWDRIMLHRMGQIRAELEGRSDGAEVMKEFAALGPVPGVAA